MDFRWVMGIVLWTLLVGPILGPFTAPSTPADDEPATMLSMKKAARTGLRHEFDRKAKVPTSSLKPSIPGSTGRL